MLENSKLSRYKIGKVVECSCIDIDAAKTAPLLKLNRKTVNRYFLVSRRLIHSFFDPTRIRGRPGPRKRGRGTLGQPIFGIYERDGAIYAEPVTDCPAKMLQAIIRGKVPPGSIVHSEGWKGCDGLVDIGYDTHFRISKSKHLAEKPVHINSIKAFWSFTRRRLARFNGVKRNFELHLEKCEWRYNRTLPQLLANLKFLVSKNKNLMV